MNLLKLTIWAALICGMGACMATPYDGIVNEIGAKVKKLHVGMSREMLLSVLKPKKIVTLPKPSTEMYIFEGELDTNCVWLAIELGRTRESDEIILTKKPDVVHVDGPSLHRIINIH